MSNIKIEDFKSTDGDLKATFVLKNSTTALANALRRTAMSQIPVFAIDLLTVYENSSAFFDEYIANRIGLVPISTPDGFTAEDEVIFTLSASGPGTVYSKELKSTTRGVSCANKEIPLTELREKQKLRLEGKARLGTGKEHAKFQAALVSYSHDAKNKEFKFFVESFGQLSAPEIVLKAAQILESKSEEFLSQLGEK